jgi:predicted nucleotidyltransferase
MQSEHQLSEEVRLLVESSGRFSWDKLLDEATEVVVFGSRAAGCGDESSDLDLLCVDCPFVRRASRIDLVRVSKAFVQSDRWLTSELANHIAAYGKWLKGKGDWRHNVRITEETIREKRAQILIRAVRLAHWDSRFSSAVKRREQVKQRRDLQRLHLMMNRSPTPASAILDKEWIASLSSQRADPLPKWIEGIVLEFSKEWDAISKAMIAQLRSAE